MWTAHTKGLLINKPYSLHVIGSQADCSTVFRDNGAIKCSGLTASRSHERAASQPNGVKKVAQALCVEC